MQYLVTTACRLDRSKARAFFAEIQQWEVEAMDSPDAPLEHAVYLDRDDPDQALVLTRFAGKEQADRFMSGPLHADFRDRLLRCATEVASTDRYDLFYAADRSGNKVIYGEQA